MFRLIVESDMIEGLSVAHVEADTVEELLKGLSILASQISYATGMSYEEVVHGIEI